MEILIPDHSQSDSCDMCNSNMDGENGLVFNCIKHQICVECLRKLNGITSRRCPNCRGQGGLGLPFLLVPKFCGICKKHLTSDDANFFSFHCKDHCVCLACAEDHDCLNYDDCPLCDSSLTPNTLDSTWINSLPSLNSPRTRKVILAHDIKYNSVVLHWDNQGDTPSMISIQQMELPDGDFTQIYKYRGNLSKFTVTNLKQNTHYRFVVLIEVNGVHKEVFVLDNIKTRTYAGSTRFKPTNFKAPGIQCTSLSLTWNCQSTPQHFVIYRDGKRETDIKGHENNIAVKNLDVNTSYTFGVMAQWDTWNSEIAYVTVTTKNAYPECPRNIQSDNITSTSAEIDWTEDHYRSENFASYFKYRIQYKNLSSEEYINGAVVGGDVFEYKLEDLNPNTEYKIRVREESWERAGDWEYITITTLSTEEYVTDLLSNTSLTILQKLRQGRFADVYIVSGRDSDKAVLKIIRHADQHRSMADIENMTSLNHVNLVSILQIFDDNNSICIIMQFLNNGSLLSYLRNDYGNQIGLLDMIEMKRQILQGMVYLEEHNIIHGDLRASNVMCDDLFKCKIAEFGIWKTYEPGSSLQTSQPIPWIALELLQGGIHTSKSDVWSFGVTAYEILTKGEVPYSGKSDEEVCDFVSKGHKEISPNMFEYMHIQSCDVDIWQNMCDIMQQCWIRNADKRQSFVDLQMEYRYQNLEIKRDLTKL